MTVAEFERQGRLIAGALKAGVVVEGKLEKTAKSVGSPSELNRTAVGEFALAASSVRQ